MTFSLRSVVSRFLRPVAVVGQHVLQPVQRQDGLPTEVEEDLGADLCVRPLEPVVEQTLVDQADELGAEVGVIDRPLHERLLPPSMTGSGPRSSLRRTAWIVASPTGTACSRMCKARATGSALVVVPGPEQDAAVGPQRERTVGRAAVDQPEQGHQPGPGRVLVEQGVGPALVCGWPPPAARRATGRRRTGRRSGR